jgi:LPS-assembly lipoprotein
MTEPQAQRLPDARPSLSRRRLLRGVGVVGVATLLVACGFEPLHAPQGPAGQMRGRIAVDTVPGAAGFAFRERLVERLGPAEAPTHRLSVELDMREESAAITRDALTTRFVVIGTAAFRLVPNGATEPLIVESVSVQSGYSTPEAETASAFAARAAALAAEERIARTLADRIALRLALLDLEAPGP